MSASRCGILGLYAIICRDPDTATGGLDPADTVLHAPGFYRHDRQRLEDLTGSGIDRKVQIVYLGTSRWHTYVEPTTGFQMRTEAVKIRVGYFAGDHVNETMASIAEDNQQIAHAISKTSNHPVCDPGECVNGYVPRSSEVIKIDEQRYVLEIEIAMQVTG